MPSPRLALVLVAASFLFTACSGRNFVRPPDNVLELGTTTAQQIRQMMGETGREELIFMNNKAVTKLTYSYTPLLKATEEIKTRLGIFYFHENVLVGYQFLSSFPEDNTDFRDARSSIKKGVTHEDEVLKRYTYAEASGWVRLDKTYHKSVRIDVDRNGIVNDIYFQSFEQRY